MLVPSTTPWQHLSCGTDHTLALAVDGTLWGWGSNVYGQLALGRRNGGASTPTRLHPDPCWQHLFAGHFCSLLIHKDGTLWGMGNNGNGRLGVPDAFDNRVQCIPLDPNHRYRHVTGGDTFSLGLRHDHTLWTWGHFDPLVPPSPGPHVAPPQQLGHDITAVAAGAHHILALQSNGTLLTCGANHHGQLGLGHHDPVTTLQPLSTSGPWRALFAAADCSFALHADGTLHAWGNNDHGQLGLGHHESIASPQALPHAPFTTLAPGTTHVLALTHEGQLWGWGSDHTQQLDGLGDTPTPRPLARADHSPWLAVAAGADFSAGLKPDGTLLTWGDNSHRQLGYPPLRPPHADPQTPLGVAFSDQPPHKRQLPLLLEALHDCLDLDPTFTGRLEAHKTGLFRTKHHMLSLRNDDDERIPILACAYDRSAKALLCHFTPTPQPLDLDADAPRFTSPRALLDYVDARCGRGTLTRWAHALSSDP